MEVTARTAVPMRNHAVVNFRWGVRVPSKIKSAAGISLQKIPFLVMNKIGIEHGDGPDPKTTAKANQPSSPENGLLRKAVDVVTW